MFNQWPVGQNLLQGMGPSINIWSFEVLLFGLVIFLLWRHMKP
jgi:hypothetical protein